jgi:hypothetical protein
MAQEKCGPHWGNAHLCLRQICYLGIHAVATGPTKLCPRVKLNFD